MACFYPKSVYQEAPGLKPKFSGFYASNLSLPCGKCIGCRLATVRGWAIRCVHEGQMHEKTCFVTLTLDEEHLPHDGGLDVRHWQLFAKKMRKDLGPFRFFMCGEYGEKKGRPHYHAILFGIDFREDRKEWNRNGDKVEWKSEKLDGLWGNGSTLIEALTFDSAAYVASYVMKKIGGPRAEKHYERVCMKCGEVMQVKPEFTLMSRGGKTGQGGLGTSWYAKFKGDVYPEDCVVMKGKKWRPPVFYDLKLAAEDPKLWQRIRDRRLEKSPFSSLASTRSSINS